MDDMMRLTRKQKYAILKCSKDNDYCTKAGYRTMSSLVRKGIAQYTQGFGYKYGEIIELTSYGKEVLKSLKT